MLNLLIGYFLKLTFREKSRWSEVSNQTIYFVSNLLFLAFTNAEKKRKGKHNIVVNAFDCPNLSCQYLHFVQAEDI